ncbi:tail assembly chaperone [Bacillus phage JL]|uniref:Tail assembly chaperone n=1 Tax=Bacillus phage JL TaxID=1296655 RepID=S5MSK0_9CAUD|nr:tail assembly chaperone [Bacillus phage JL]AGR46777.1 tail assembly chaperone [Bacillus phage JL]
MSENIKTVTLNTLQDINQGDARTHTFKADFTDVDPTFVGMFTVHHPNMMDELAIGRLYASLKGGLEVDQFTDNIATVVSTLDVVLDKKPEWFHVGNSKVDYPMWEVIYLEYRNWVESFRKPDKKDNNEGDSKDKPSEVRVVGTDQV